MTRLSIHAFPQTRAKVAGRVWYTAADGKTITEYLVIRSTRKSIWTRPAAGGKVTRRFEKDQWDNLHLSRKSAVHHLLNKQEAKCQKLEAQLQMAREQWMKMHETYLDLTISAGASESTGAPRT